jgi:2-keto-4-pentenoate hydratase/2-oxohepta-3-ene-1,7-dioic acid hydratase in catechol pathway
MAMKDDAPRAIMLFCWILDVSDRSFSISIDDTQTVDDLKEEILAKKSTTFASVGADQLTLWKVSGTFNFR